MSKYRGALYAFAIIIFTATGVLIGSSVDILPKKNTTISEEIAIPGITKDNYPVVNGSTSTIPLGQLVLSRALGLPGKLSRAPLSWESVGLTLPLDADMERVNDLRMLFGRIRHFGTNQSYMTLILPGKEPDPTLPTSDWRYMPYGQRADLILVAREPSEDELKAAEENKVELDVRPVAMDAFVFLVNKDNPVESLTLDQIRGIYTGEVTNWKALGGNDEAIVPFIRDRNSGSQELMESLVMQGREIIEAKENMLMGMGGPIERVSSTPNAIAYSVFYYEQVMNCNPQNRLLAVDGVFPTRETLADRSYPLTAEVYVVTRKGIPADSPAAILRDWLLSNDGQRLVAESAYVPISR